MLLKSLRKRIQGTFFSVELDSETTRITSSISTTLLTTDSRETSENGSLLTNVAQELGLGDVSDIVSDLYTNKKDMGSIITSFNQIRMSSLPKTP